MNNLLVLPFHDFKFALEHGFSTRDSHIYEYFIEDPSIDNVVIINRPTSLAEILIRRKKVKSLDNVIFKKNGVYVQEYLPGVYVIDFIVSDFFNVLRMKHAWLPYIYSSKKIYKKTREALEFIGINEFSCYMSSPFTAILGKKLNAEVTMLDAVDNLTKFKNWSYFKETIQELYMLAKRDFDHIIVNSKDSLSFFGNESKASVEFIASGADMNNFKGEFLRPFDLPKGKPIVGYAGKIQRMFDAELFEELARSNPDMNFVIVGKILDSKWKRTVWDKHMEGLKNVHFLGFKKYENLPSYYAHFDICIIPYIIENQHGGDPIKFYEYMASSKPIVSMNIGEINSFHNGESVFICDNREEFIRSFIHLKEHYNELSIDYEILYNSWSQVAEKLKQKLFSR